MKVALCYVFPNVQHRIYEPLARRFTAAYVNNAVATDHELFVCVNGGGEITPRQEQLFAPLCPEFIYHTNAGRDIGAYQMAAGYLSCDLLVCIGSPVRPCEPGWLDYMVQAVENNGPGLYGCWAFHEPAPHIRTTLFWTQPQVLNAYPHPVDNSRRYEFEFGPKSITQFCAQTGLQTLQVTKAGVFNRHDWHHVERDESIMLDQHTDNLRYV